MTLTYVIWAWEMLRASFYTLILYALVYTILAEGMDRYRKWRGKCRRKK